MSDTPRIPGGHSVSPRIGPKGRADRSRIPSVWSRLFGAKPVPQLRSRDGAQRTLPQPVTAEVTRSETTAAQNTQKPDPVTRPDPVALRVPLVLRAVPTPEPVPSAPVAPGALTHRVVDRGQALPAWIGTVDAGEQILWRRKATEKWRPEASLVSLASDKMGVIVLPVINVFFLVAQTSVSGFLFALILSIVSYPWVFLPLQKLYERDQTHIFVSNTRVYTISAAFRTVISHTPLRPNTKIEIIGNAIQIGPNPPPHHPIWDTWPLRLARFRKLTFKPHWDGLHLEGFDAMLDLHDKLRAVAAAAPEGPDEF